MAVHAGVFAGNGAPGSTSTPSPFSAWVLQSGLLRLPNPLAIVKEPTQATELLPSGDVIEGARAAGDGAGRVACARARRRALICRQLVQHVVGVALPSAAACGYLRLVNQGHDAGPRGRRGGRSADAAKIVAELAINNRVSGQVTRLGWVLIAGIC